MLSYLVRRLLLFVPTLVGATAVMFFVMAAAPTKITDALLPPGGDLQPGVRAAREAYIEERYGLNRPIAFQYARWLNNISPVGFRTWSRADPEVQDANARERADRDARRPELAAQGVRDPQLARELRQQINYAPSPGEVQSWVPWFKAPDLGESYVKGRRTWTLVREALPVTLTLQLIAMPVWVTLAILTGVWAAYRRGKIADVGVGTTLLGLYSMPAIWVGVMLIGFLANKRYAYVFPTGGLNDAAAAAWTFLPSWSADGTFVRGWLLDRAWHLALPVLCVSYAPVAFLSKITRTSMLETLSSDLVRTARAKGLREKVVLWRHAFRNSLLPIITVGAGLLPGLVVGSVVVETIFGLPGMGRLTVDALKDNDRELFLSTSTLILVLQLVAYLIADLAYTVADPRVSYE